MHFNKKAPVRTAFFSPLMSVENGKFHVIIGGGQDPKDVTTTKSKEGGFESKLYNMITHEELAIIKGHFGPVHSLEISPDGRTLVTASEDGTIRAQRFPLEYIESPKDKFK